MSLFVWSLHLIVGGRDEDRVVLRVNRELLGKVLLCAPIAVKPFRYALAIFCGAVCALLWCEAASVRIRRCSGGGDVPAANLIRVAFPSPIVASCPILGSTAP